MQMKFEDVIKKYDKLIYNLARRWMGNNEDAQDVSQEVALKIYNNLDRCQGEQFLPAWISRITYNASMDALRKKKGKIAESLDEMMSFDDSETAKQVPDNDPTPEDRLLQKEVAQQIEKALEKLPLKYRTLILLRDWQGRSYEEVAEITSIPLGTVKSRIFRGRTKLKEILLQLGVKA